MKLIVKLICKDKRNIEQLYGTFKRAVEIFKVILQLLLFEMFFTKRECVNTEKEILIYLPNPIISEIYRMFPQLRILQFIKHGEEL